MSFQPPYDRAQVERLLATGELTRFQIYALQHQHPLNRLTHVVGVPLILVSAVWVVAALPLTGELGWRFWLIGQGIGWPLQILGHRIEGNRPAFFADLWQLAIGPLFFLWEPIRILLGRPLIELPPHLQSLERSP